MGDSVSCARKLQSDVSKICLVSEVLTIQRIKGRLYNTTLLYLKLLSISMKLDFCNVACLPLIRFHQSLCTCKPHNARTYVEVLGA